MSPTKEKAVDEVFCRTCGEPIKEKAEICPECGVRNEEASSTSRGASSGTPSSTHDPSLHETTVTDTWWYGVVGGTILWVLVLILAGTVGEGLGAFAGFLVLVAWIGLPIAAYFDMEYIRANGEWNPNTVLWLVLLSIWLVNIFAGAVYLNRRHEVLGTP